MQGNRYATFVGSAESSSVQRKLGRVWQSPHSIASAQPPQARSSYYSRHLTIRPPVRWKPGDHPERACHTSTVLSRITHAPIHLVDRNIRFPLSRTYCPCNLRHGSSQKTMMSVSGKRRIFSLSRRFHQRQVIRRSFEVERTLSMLERKYAMVARRNSAISTASARSYSYSLCSGIRYGYANTIRWIRITYCSRLSTAWRTY